MTPHPTLPQSSGNVLRARRADLALLAIVWCLSSLLIISGSRFIPYDSIDAFFPQVRFVVSSVLRGEPPWWNPYQYAGIPVLADPQNMVFTLHTLVGLLLGEHFNLLAFDVATLTYQLIGGFALYFYARATDARRYNAVLGTIVFFLGGVAASRLQHVPQIVSYSMLPMLLLGVLHLSRAPSYRRALALGLLVGLFLLNPNQLTFIGGLLLLPFALLHCWQNPTRVRCLAMAAFAAAIALVIALPMIAAVLEFVGDSNRASLGLEASTAASLPAYALTSLLLPGLFGVASGQQWVGSEFTQSYLYIGAIPALLILTTLVSAPLSQNRIANLALISGLAAGVYLLGTRTPLYPWLFTHVPGFSLFRRPADGAYLINLFLALFLASARIDKTESLFAGRWRNVAALSLIGIFIVLAFPQLKSVATKSDAIADLQRVLMMGLFRYGVASFVLWGAWRWTQSGRDTRFILPLIAGLVMVDLVVPGKTSELLSLRYAERPIARFYAGRKEPSDTKVAEYHQLVEFLKDGVFESGIPQFRVEIIGDELAYGFPSAVSLASTQGANPLLISPYSRLFPSTYDARPKTFSVDADTYLHRWYRRIGLRYVVLPHYVTDLNDEQFGEAGTTITATRRSLQSGGARMVKAGYVYEVWELPAPNAKVVVYAAATAPASPFDAKNLEQSANLLHHQIPEHRNRDRV